LWQPLALARALPAAQIAAQTIGGGYALEAALPWSVFEVTPAAGRSYGLVLALNDDDTPGSAEQQTQLTNRKDQALADPTTWSTLFLDLPPPP
jgi:hypothetical protein